MVKCILPPVWSLKKLLLCLEEWEVKNTLGAGMLVSLGENLSWIPLEFNIVKASISLFRITKEFGTKTLKDLAIKIVRGTENKK